MKIVKSPQTIYLKDLEREELELIANIKNIERTKEGKNLKHLKSYTYHVATGNKCRAKTLKFTEKRNNTK